MARDVVILAMLLLTAACVSPVDARVAPCPGCSQRLVNDCTPLVGTYALVPRAWMPYTSINDTMGGQISGKQCQPEKSIVIKPQCGVVLNTASGYQSEFHLYFPGNSSDTIGCGQIYFSKDWIRQVRWDMRHSWTGELSMYCTDPETRKPLGQWSYTIPGWNHCSNKSQGNNAGASGPTSSEVTVKSIGKLAEPETPAPNWEVQPSQLAPITGRVHYLRKDYFSNLKQQGGQTYPAGVPVHCFWGKHQLCSTTTTAGGYFKCDNTMLLEPDMAFYCQFEAIPGVTHRYRMRETKGTSDLGDVAIYPDRRGLPGCKMNKCGPETAPIVGELLQALGLPADGDLAVPDCWFGDFCDNHDCCYSECGVSQALCDTEFRELANSLCRAGDGKHTPYYIFDINNPHVVDDVCFALGGCNEATTTIYHDTLKKLGPKAFGAAQRNCLNN